MLSASGRGTMRFRKETREPISEEERAWVRGSGAKSRVEEYVVRRGGSWEDCVLLWSLVRDLPWEDSPHWNLFDAVESAYPYRHYIPEKKPFDVEKERERMRDLRTTIDGLKATL